MKQSAQGKILQKGSGRQFSLSLLINAARVLIVSSFGFETPGRPGLGPLKPHVPQARI